MSKQHGDKARFHRLRKQRIARRQNAQALREKIALARVPVVETVAAETLVTDSVKI